MNAIEFVEKFGWDKAYENINYLERSYSLSVNRQTLLDDLKTLVDAWELVERLGGFESAVKERDFRRINNILQSYDKELSDAISLLEQCQ